jgi:hypothetical protein
MAGHKVAVEITKNALPADRIAVKYSLPLTSNGIFICSNLMLIGDDRDQ